MLSPLVTAHFRMRLILEATWGGNPQMGYQGWEPKGPEASKLRFKA
jgi:hypothetical protein